MAVTASTMLPLGTEAPDFSLPDVDGEFVALSDFKEAPALLIIFMCNHCPFVKHIMDKLLTLIKEYQQQGVAVAAINSNDATNYPEDRPEMMVRLAKEKGFTFPYLYDGTQKVAKAYKAACTPDFFLFDKDKKLIYRGRMDDSTPSTNVPVTGRDLTAALDAALAGNQVPCDQKPSMGCNIKWREGNEPKYG